MVSGTGEMGVKEAVTTTKQCGGEFPRKIFFFKINFKVRAEEEIKLWTVLLLTRVPSCHTTAYAWPGHTGVNRCPHLLHASVSSPVREKTGQTLTP